MLDSLSAYVPDWINPYLSADGPVLSILTLISIWVVYKVSRRLLERYLNQRAYKEENVQHFLFIWRYAWLGLGFILFLVSFSGDLATLGISAAFLGMILGWSLQAPVTGIAAWLMIILKQPFKIGDRIIIAGIIGDVVDINLTHVILNQVGGTVGGEEKSGRGVLIPNATLFGQIIYNYTLEGVGSFKGKGVEGEKKEVETANFILDEVPVRLTFGSDFEKAERILIEAASQVTAHIISSTGQEPFIRAEFFDSGLIVRLRYQTEAKDRQRITSDIVRVIIREFAADPDVEFCYPHMNLYYNSGKVGGAPPPALG